MSLPRLDLATLQAGSILTSLAFAGVFLWLWRASRPNRHLAHWAAGLLVYAGAIVAFACGFSATGPIATALLYAILAGSTAFIVSGVRAFDGQTPFARWMTIPPLVAFGAILIPHAIGLPALARPAGTASLALGMATFGLALIRGRWHGNPPGRRLVGWALLGYIPGYAVALASETLHASPIDMVATIALLLDQILLLAINIALLAMPGERASRILRESALHDALTGARNRAWLATHGDAIAMRGTAAILIDIDHFKAINDRHGHAAGDAVLVALVAGMRALQTPGGVEIVRLGGDEFLALLPGATRDTALRFAETTRGLAAMRAADVPDWTASLGIALAERGETALAAALARADASLYRAKAAGRDRVAA